MSLWIRIWPLLVEVIWTNGIDKYETSLWIRIWPQLAEVIQTTGADHCFKHRMSLWIRIWPLADRILCMIVAKDFFDGFRLSHACFAGGRRPVQVASLLVRAEELTAGLLVFTGRHRGHPAPPLHPRHKGHTFVVMLFCHFCLFLFWLRFQIWNKNTAGFLKQNPNTWKVQRNAIY